MNKSIIKKQKRVKRHLKIRSRISGTAERPRLVVYKSLKHIYAQIVDDSIGKTIVNIASSSKEYTAIKGNKKEKAEKIGEAIAKKAIEKGIKKIVFDRNGYKYHGRVKILADSARKAGLVF